VYDDRIGPFLFRQFVVERRDLHEVRTRGGNQMNGFFHIGASSFQVLGAGLPTSWFNRKSAAFYLVLLVKAMPVRAG